MKTRKRSEIRRLDVGGLLFLAFAAFRLIREIRSLRVDDLVVWLHLFPESVTVARIFNLLILKKQIINSQKIN